MALPSPVLPGVYHLAPLSWGVWSSFSWDGLVGAYGLWRGQKGGISCRDTVFPPHFILNKTLRLWHECGASAVMFESKTVKFVWELENNSHW